MSNTESVTLFSPADQARRILRADWRLIGFDVGLGVVYVGLTSIVAPGGMIAAALVVAYLTYRLIQDETDPTAALFVSNLPRDRALAWTVRIRLLVAIALLLSVVVVAGSATLPRVFVPEREFAAPPVARMFALLLAMQAAYAGAVLWWRYYGRAGFIVYMAVIPSQVGVMALLMHCIPGPRLNDPLPAFATAGSWIALVGFAAIAGVLIVAARRSYLSRQIGEETCES